MSGSAQADSETFLGDLLVVEIGDRRAVAACGSILAELGATVVFVETKEPTQTMTKWGDRALAAAGKRSVLIDPACASDLALLRAAISKADVVLTSSDVDRTWAAQVARSVGASAVVCDITAFGSSGPLAGRSYSDVLVQAITGVVDTTGDPDDAPVLTEIPVTESSAAVYGVAGVLAALRVRERDGIAQPVEIALYDCAVSALTTFLPACFSGKEAQRVGNHHPSMSPWNAYRALDGWVMLCAGSDEMWRRVCEVIERPELAGDERYATPTHRVRINSQIDHMVEAWTLQHPVSYCIERLIAAALPCGPIYSIAELLQEASLVHREMVRELHDPVSGKSVRVPGALFHATAASGRAADSIPAPGADREFIEQRVLRTTRTAKKRSGSAASARPLTGIRVIEIGSYTTAPLCARQLAALGADVVKVEPPIGDPARVLPPFLGRQGYFFTMNNSDKRAVTLDLRTSEGKTALRDLLACADVFVDNLKPGSLSRLGFGRDDLARLNPRLIHCSVSGFGADSPLADRPGMDTTIQGMAGIMYLTRSGDTPFKTGVSIADLTGAQLALAAILASLAYRERVGKGLAIDLSMQDAGAWLTRGAWNGPQSASAPATLICCEDGYVVAEAAADALRTAVPEHLSSEASSDALTARLTREAIVTLLKGRSVRSASVLRVGEVLQQAQTKVRELIVKGTAPDGTEWPLLASPIRLALTPAAVKRPIGDAAPDASGVLVEWLETNQKERKSLNA